MMTTFLRRALTAAGALTLTAVLVAAQAPQARPKYDPLTVPEFRPEFDRATKMGLPTEPLVTKAKEGYVKQASTRTIRDALHALTDGMQDASKALNPVHSTAELAAGADAIMKYNVSSRVLRGLRSVQKTRSLEMAIGVLEDLVSKGVPMRQAAATVQNMLQHNVTDVAMADVAHNVQNDLAVGVAPSVALDLRSKGVLSLPQAPIAGAVAGSPRR